MDPKTFKLLQEADWGTVGKELLAFAEWWAGNYHWRCGGKPDLAQGKTLEDIVQEIVVKTLNGERRWDPNKGPLVPWLKDQVKSVVDALAKSAAHRYEIGVHEGEDEERLDYIVEHHTYAETAAAIQSLGPEDTILEQEAKDEIEQKVNDLFEAVSGDAELEEIFEAILDGCGSKPRELAAELRVPVADIYNRVKRLRRRTLKGQK